MHMYNFRSSVQKTQIFKFYQYLSIINYMKYIFPFYIDHMEIKQDEVRQKSIRKFSFLFFFQTLNSYFTLLDRDQNRSNSVNRLHLAAD